jgi:hypothetical protein
MLLKLITLIATLIAVFLVAAKADDHDEIRAVLQRFNESVRKSESQPFRTLFTSQADYRDATRVLKGSDVLASLFAKGQVWSERTPPMLQEQTIRLVGTSAALVDAHLVQYGSSILKSSVPVVLLLEKDTNAWRISSWRMFRCAAAVPIN